MSADIGPGFTKELVFSEDLSFDTKRALENIYTDWKELDRCFSSIEYKKELEEVQWFRNTIKQRIESFLLLNGVRVIKSI